MDTVNGKQIGILTVLLTLALIVASACGAFIPATYEKETASLAAQGVGQDLVNLFLVAPGLIITLIYTIKGNVRAALILEGLLFYTIYSYIIYALGIHFNYLFLVYCAVLGLSLYSFILVFMWLMRTDISQISGKKIPARSTGSFMIVVSVIFYLLWLKDIVPAVLGGYVPASVADYNLLVNPVHVIDISFALPGLIIASILLFRRHRTAYILAPIALVFMIFMALALVAMVILTRVRGIAEDASIAIIFLVMTVVSIFFIARFLAPERSRN